ncbi:ABC exporter membrane fusion protein, DevB family [Pleurocapsa sp. PCC 7327]|uniref:ABC exporter membrane fusion protein n=1 Tax=Pleurocapsa sp. PCC 7327 TaxID=118163 RepID=UPI00029F8DEE|nr:ABC exporter membrane fusion protein [Pleurocapsa sp. PCC 7327]AFY76377.1 ABC exporter membrane fusion protein, DevB family [Pleurocapsa sp. PCC 7327]
MQKRLHQKKVNPWVIGSAIAAFLGVGVSYYTLTQVKTQSPPPASTKTVVRATAVTALGRLEPQGEVIKLSVANAQDSRVNQLLVQEGDRVKAGQVIAILQGLDKRKAALAEAEQNLAIARAKLAQIQAGEAKTAEIAAQRSNIARLEAQLRTETTAREAEIARAEAALRNAQTTYRRYQTLYRDGAVSASDLDNKRESFETARAQLNLVRAQLETTVSTLQEQIQQERSLLNKLTEVRPVDVQVARAEVDYAATQVARAKAELDDLYVRVPVAGQILKINTRIGEQVNTSEGIVELGQTDRMYAIAEVYETDIGKIRVGQRATIISEHGGFEGELGGTVDHIGLQIKKKDVLESDPAAEKDARVVEVKVRIDPSDSPKVAGLTNLQVRVKIDLDKKVSKRLVISC